ncbi:hypothetical protein SAMN05192588_2312 [Nonlabens sp. Hel1_33_55]|uniref:hypothetical protein n=1 Tax=Nonlabens sp. Hel1_33_55 TaxID=1336802 RepID=UPI000875C004|nr:hypothetical protein [Nonlabens sp. Hel1_33_55]SCY33242.1 hypothetical protein SAMN05192588_2312 [Nonlabens sp. Hel1_33_55]
MDLSYVGPIIILIFLLITYIISAFEKIHDWKVTEESFKKMYSETILAKMIVPVITLIVAFEIIIVTLAALGIWDIIIEQNFEVATFSFLASSILCLFLLIGLRLINDYSGTSRIGIYFLISIFGLYWVQSIVSIA